MIVIFEGPDGAGKDTIRAAFEKQTQYEHTCLTRFFISQAVFAQYFKRPLFTDFNKNQEYLRFMRQFTLQYNPLVVYVRADAEVLRGRYLARGENPADQPEPVKIMGMYEKLFSALGLDISPRLLTIDTTLKTPADVAEAAERVVGKVKALSARRPK